MKASGLTEIKRKLEEAIDLVKTKQGDARVILVGGGSIIIPGQITGVGEVIRPRYLEVANAVGAAIAKVSGIVDSVVVPGEKTIDQHIEAAKALAKEKCVAAGGDEATIQVVEVDVVPMSYVTNGATRILVRVAGDLVDGYEEQYDESELEQPPKHRKITNTSDKSKDDFSKGSSYEIKEKVDIPSYRPRIEGDYWYLSELDIDFLQDGTGVLGVGSCGEPYPAYVACLQALRSGKDIKIRRQDTFPDDGVVLVAGFMVGHFSVLVVGQMD